MNKSAVNYLIFFAEFDENGRLTESSRREFHSCLEKTESWGAAVRIVHARSASERVWMSSDYDNSPQQKRLRRIDYTLSSLVAEAKERGLQAEYGLVYGAAGLQAAGKVADGLSSFAWSEVSKPASCF